MLKNIKCHRCGKDIYKKGQYVEPVRCGDVFLLCKDCYDLVLKDISQHKKSNEVAFLRECDICKKTYTGNGRIYMAQTVLNGEVPFHDLEFDVCPDCYQNIARYVCNLYDAGIYDYMMRN